MCVSFVLNLLLCFFFFQAEDGIRDLTVTGVQTCALPILAAAAEKYSRIVQVGSQRRSGIVFAKAREIYASGALGQVTAIEAWIDRNDASGDRKSTRLNSSHSQISYAVFCLKKKKKTEQNCRAHT